MHGGPLPLSPAASLAWLGFAEEGLLAAYDTEGELRLRSADFGGSWVTAFSAAAGGPLREAPPSSGIRRHALPLTRGPGMRAYAWHAP